MCTQKYTLSQVLVVFNVFIPWIFFFLRAQWSNNHLRLHVPLLSAEQNRNPNKGCASHAPTWQTEGTWCPQAHRPRIYSLPVCIQFASVSGAKQEVLSLETRQRHCKVNTSRLKGNLACVVDGRTDEHGCYQLILYSHPLTVHLCKTTKIIPLCKVSFSCSTELPHTSHLDTIRW